MKPPRQKVARRLALLAASTACALRLIGEPASTPQEISKGLFYAGGTNASEIINTLSETASKHALILDLRNLSEATDSEAETLSKLLHESTEQRSFYILVGQHTSQNTIENIARLPSKTQPIVVATLAAVSAKIPRAIFIETNDEPKILAALASGQSPASLIGKAVKKKRRDEAALLESLENGTSLPRHSLPETPKEKASPSSDHPIDTALRRAVFLHQALIALGHTARA